MKLKIHAVKQEQQDLAKAFAAPQPRVSLSRQTWEHMEMLFKSQRYLCEAFDTTPKTWRDIKSDEGVREATAQRVLIEFISLLHKIANKKMRAGDDIHGELVPALDKIYAPYLSNLNFGDLIERKHK